MKQIAALLIGFALAAPAFAQDEDVANTAPIRPVKLATIGDEENTLSRRFFGRVRARETVDLAFQVGGQIVQLPIVEGAPLPKGALIAALDLEPYERQLQQAEVNRDKAKRDLERLENLSRSTVSEVQVQDARTQFQLAEISVDQAQDQLEDATLNTTFDALVARREVANFTTVSAGQPIVRLHDMSELRVDIEVPEILFRRAADDGSVTFNATFPGVSDTFPLVLREYEAETAEVAQTFALTLAFTTEMPAWVLPGASVTVTAQAIENTGREIVLPDTAVVFDPDRNAGVMVFTPLAGDDSQGTVALTPVQIEIRDDARILVRDGLTPGAEVVVAGANRLRDGDTVRRFTKIGE